MLLFLSAILLLSSMKEKPYSNLKQFVNIKWHLEEISKDVNATVCFKSDNTFWHYRTNGSQVDSLMFSKWGVENDKIYFLIESLANSKIAYIKIVSCDSKYMLIEDLTQKRNIKLRKANSSK